MTTKTTTRKSKTRKTDRYLAKFDADIEKRCNENNKALAFGIAGLVAKNRRIEWEIVSNYLTRNKMVMVGEEA